MAGIPSQSPLHVAAADGDVASLRVALESSHDLETSEFGFTPMQHAAWQGHVECVRLLLDAGAAADPPSPDLMGGSMHEGPLQFAAEGGHVEIARVLLDAGADANRSATSGWSPLTYACWSRETKVELVELLRERGADPAGLPREMAWSRHLLGGIDALSDLAPPDAPRVTVPSDLLDDEELAAVVEAMRAVEQRDDARLARMMAFPDSDIYLWTRSYGRWGTVDVIAPPGDPRTWRMHVLRFDDGDPILAAVDLDVWTQQEGQSDLTLSLELHRGPAGVRAQIQDMHVL